MAQSLITGQFSSQIWIIHGPTPRVCVTVFGRRMTQEDIVKYLPSTSLFLFHNDHTQQRSEYKHKHVAIIYQRGETYGSQA